MKAAGVAVKLCFSVEGRGFGTLEGGGEAMALRREDLKPGDVVVFPFGKNKKRVSVVPLAE